MKLIVTDGLTPIEHDGLNWHRGFINLNLFYFPAVQLDTLNVFWGIERPIDKLRLIKIIPQIVLFDNTTGFILPGAKVIWNFRTVSKYPTYNPIGVGRLLNGAISGKLDNYISFSDYPTDYNIDIDYYSDSSANFFQLIGQIYLPVVF
jgi:hypothetical protein